MLKGEVLLLNKSFEVLRVIPIRRALCMMTRGNNPARTVLGTGRICRTAGGLEMEIPSIVALSEFRDIRGNIRKANIRRLRVLTRDGFRCMYCGVKPGIAKLTLDHVMPKSKGGDLHDPENLVSACKPCNNKKANRTPEQAGMPLLRKPKPVNTGFDRIMNRYYLEKHPEWADYLFFGEGDKKFQHKGE